MLPSEIGESWFGVETTARPEESLTSQAQPEPKRAMPAFLNSSLKASKEPKVSSIARAELAARLAAAVGAEHLPEERVVVVAAGVVADRALLVAGQAGEVAQHVLDVAVGPLGALEGGVRFVDVGLVVLVVVDAHRRLVDVGLERVVGVGKVGNRESHLGVSSWSMVGS